MILATSVEREFLSDGQAIFVAFCLELDIACQGETAGTAKQNLADSVKLFCEVASPSEFERCLLFSGF